MGYVEMDNRGTIVNAANLIKQSDNPPFVLSDFYSIFPQFENKLSDTIIQMYIDFANSCVDSVKWGDAWKLGMCNFVAHFCVIQMQGSLKPESTESQVLAAAQSKGLISSKSAGDVSISYDFNFIMQDLNGWAQWKLTPYGIQFASLGKLMGKGAVYVW